MTRILLPLAILEGESVPAGLAAFLEPLEVTVLGYHELPEQTPPDQARLQYGKRARAALEDVTSELGAADGTADHRLVFTHDEERTIDRVAGEVDASAYAITGTTGPIDRLLVALTGDVAVERIVAFVASVIDGREIDVTLFLATDDAESGRALLDTAATTLRDEGVDVRTELAVEGGPLESLLAAAVDHDAIVMGERAPSLRTLVFGDDADRVAAASVGPVIVVRHPPLDGESAE